MRTLDARMFEERSGHRCYQDDIPFHALAETHIFTEVSDSRSAKEKGPTFRLGLFKLKRATSYAPTHLRVQYHRG